MLRSVIGIPTSPWSCADLGDRLLARYDDRGNVEHVIGDYIGFPLATYSYGGDELWQAEAFPFGAILDEQSSGPGHDPLLRYPGQWRLDPYLDTDEPDFTTLYHNYHRWYNPRWGRYTQSDPIGDAILNAHEFQWPSDDNERFALFTYAGGNPLLYIDPLGLLKFKGCSPQQQQAINDAMNAGCASVDSDDFAKCMCEKPGITRKLRKRCRNPNVTVRCKPGSGRFCQGKCGYAVPFGRTIRLCSSAWDEGLCGPLGCTLIHEMTHQIGRFREKGPRTVEKCLGLGCRY